jgi:hypothetical protein
MRLLFDRRWTQEIGEAAGVPPERVEAFLDLEKTAQRVDAAIQRTFVWASVKDLPAPKFLVRDVRILCETRQLKPHFYATNERLQVLLLEGWQTPERIWTDEEEIEVIEGVQ